MKAKKILMLTIASFLAMGLSSCDLINSLTKPEADMSNVYVEDQYYQYDGGEKNLLVTGTLPEGVYVYYENNGKKDIGSYEVKVNFKTDKYKPIPSQTATLNILDIDLGTYPQSIVSDASLRDNILKYGKFDKTTGDITYGAKKYRVCQSRFGWKDYYEEGKQSKFYFSDGTPIILGDVYVFEYEPIKWRCMGKTDEGLLLMSQKILDANWFFTEFAGEYLDFGYEYTIDKFDDYYIEYDGEWYNPCLYPWHLDEDKIFSNIWRQKFEEKIAYVQEKINHKYISFDDYQKHSIYEDTYKYSYIREWLNNDFYNVAFENYKDKLVKMKVENNINSYLYDFPELIKEDDGKWYKFNNDVPSRFEYDPSIERRQNDALSLYFGEDTEDYVALPSLKDITNPRYGFSGIKDDTYTYLATGKEYPTKTLNYRDMNKIANSTDYALARGCYTYWSIFDTLYGYYMTRSQNPYQGIFAVGISNGNITTVKTTPQKGFSDEQSPDNLGYSIGHMDNYGVRPMVTYKL